MSDHTLVSKPVLLKKVSHTRIWEQIETLVRNGCDCFLGGAYRLLVEDQHLHTRDPVDHCLCQRLLLQNLSMLPLANMWCDRDLLYITYDVCSFPK